MGKIRVFLDRNRPWILALTALWIFFVFGRYFWPFTHPMPPLRSLLDVGRFPDTGAAAKWAVWSRSLLMLLFPAWVLGISWSLGRRLGKWLSLSIPVASLQYCMEWGFGFFFLDTLWMGLGLVRLWFEPIWLVCEIFFSLILVRDILRLKTAPEISLALSKRWPWVWVLLGGLYLVLLALHIVLPETFYDSLNYFLGMPSFWMSQHGITDIPTHLLSGYFNGGSLFFMNALAFWGADGAKSLALTAWVLCLLCGYGWVRETAGREGAMTAGMALLTFPLLFLNAWATRVDVILSFYSLLALYCLERAGRGYPRKSRGWVVAAALFGAMALSIKPTAVVVLSAGLASLVWQNGVSLLKGTRFWVACVVFGAIVVGPWFLKNAAFAGNPFYPYAFSWMGGRHYASAGYERLLWENRQFLDMGSGWERLWKVLTLPWRLTMPQAGDGQFIGPLLLAFLPAFLVVRSQNPVLKFWGKTALLSFVLGLCLSHMLRFSMPAFLLAFMLLSSLFTLEKERALGLLWVAGITLSAILCLPRYADTSALFFDGAGIWSGRESREAYLARKLGDSYEPLVEWTDHNLPSDARLFVVGDSRGVYYRRAAFTNSAFDDQFFAQAAREEKDAAGILKRVHEMGITDVVVNIPEGKRVAADYHQYDLTPGQWMNLNEFVAQGLDPLYWKDYLAVYGVRSRLSARHGPYVADPFVFFSQQADVFDKDLRSGNLGGATLEADGILKLFPQEAYWWEQKARLDASQGRIRLAFLEYRRGDSFHGLTIEGYRDWEARAKRAGDRKEAEFALRELLKAYPSEFQD